MFITLVIIIITTVSHYYKSAAHTPSTLPMSIGSVSMSAKFCLQTFQSNLCTSCLASLFTASTSISFGRMSQLFAPPITCFSAHMSCSSPVQLFLLFPLYLWCCFAPSSMLINSCFLELFPALTSVLFSVQILTYTPLIYLVSTFPIHWSQF